MDKPVLTVMCIYCKKKRGLTRPEIAELSKSSRVPMCECGGVMVAHSATARLEGEDE